MDQWWANELWDFTHIITKHSSPNEYILFFRGLILHTNLRINALIEVLMTFKSYEGFFWGIGSYWTVVSVMYWLCQHQTWPIMRFLWISSTTWNPIMYWWRSHYAPQLLTAKRIVIWLHDHLYIELIYYYGLSLYRLYSITNHTVYVRWGSCFGTLCPFV